MENLTSLNGLVNERIFRVPDYQRGYAWTATERQDLLDDLAEIQVLNTHSHYEHFTGTVVLEDTKQNLTVPGGVVKRLEIVDGQQRLTTFVILIRQIIDQYRELGDTRHMRAAQTLEERYVKITPDGPYLLELNNDTNRFFIDTILEASTTRVPQSFAEENLLNAKREFLDFLRQKQKEHDPQFGEYLDTLTTILTSSLKFLLYQPSGQAEACFMFESMNARGLELTQLEKTKNLLFFLAYKYKTSENQLKHLSTAITDTWRDVWRNLYSAKGEEDQFLRFHWIVFDRETWMDKGDVTRTYDIHDAIRKTVKECLESADVCKWLESYLTSLRSYSPLYRDLINPHAETSFQRQAKQRDALVELVHSTQRIGREANLIPVMMASYYRYANTDEELQEIFRLAEVFSFRLLVIGRRADVGRRRAFDIACEIGHGKLLAIDAIKRLRGLISEYCDDSKFRDALEDQKDDFYHWSGIRYFLFEHERDLQRKARGQFLLDWDLFRRQEPEQSIEHILPQGESIPQSTYWNDYWGKFFSEEEWRRCRHLLGNLNLAMPHWNSSYSAKDFPAKRGDRTTPPDAMVYAHSPWISEQVLSTITDWTPEEITKRQNTLAAWAIKRWPIDVPQ